METNMLTKKNVYVFILALITQVTTVILSYFNIIYDVDKAMLIVAAIFALILLVINCLKHCGKAIVLCMISFLLVLGIGKVGIATEYVVTYCNIQIHNNKTVNQIMNSDTHHKLMAYGDKNYYVDNGYTYLYEIEKTWFGYNVVANNIMIREDIEDQLELYACEFYSMETISAFTDMKHDKVAFSFTNGLTDNGVIIKMISPDNKVFYSYIAINDTRPFVESLQISDLLFEIGKTNFYLTKPSKIINGTETGDEVDFVEGQQYLITENGSLCASSVVYIEFDEDSKYYNRINYFIYRTYFEELQKYEDALKTMIPDTDEYKTMQSEIESLKSSMPSYTCELAYEQFSGQSTIRMYRAFLMTGELEEVPNISIIEIYQDGKYIYSYTDIEIEDLY